MRLMTVLWLLGLSAATAAPMLPEIGGVQHRWAQIRYQLPADERVEALAVLAEEVGQVAASHPRDAEALIWQGIVLATLAGEKGGLGALGLAKDARASLEQALEMDPRALNGSAYTSLGSLYYQVPGWPIGFGNDKKARELLRQGLEIDPDGIDSNYFWGDFLLSEGEYEQAVAALQKALAAPPRPGREVADEGRRGEIREVLARAEQKLARRQRH